MIKTLQNMLNLDYKLDRLLSRGKNEKVIRLMKYQLGEKIMTKFFGLRA